MQCTPRQNPRFSRCSRNGRGECAFTLVELLVVVSIVVLILALAVPGLSAMNKQMRMSSAQRQVQSMLTRAYYLALAEKTMTAVRFLPAQWDADEEGETGQSERQHLALYRYVGSTDRYDGQNDRFVLEFDEYFERVPGVSSLELPAGVWVAPLEALNDETRVRLEPSSDRPGLSGQVQYFNGNFGSAFVLDGQIGSFAYDANIANRDSDAAAADFLDADDFMIVFDPQTGVISGTPAAFRLKAYAADPAVDANARIETDRDPDDPDVRYQRIAFHGVVFYEREGFVALGDNEDDIGVDRQRYLQETGIPFVVHRTGGGLVGDVAADDD